MLIKRYTYEATPYSGRPHIFNVYICIHSGTIMDADMKAWLQAIGHLREIAPKFCCCNLKLVSHTDYRQLEGN